MTDWMMSLDPMVLGWVLGGLQVVLILLGAYILVGQRGVIDRQWKLIETMRADLDYWQQRDHELHDQITRLVLHIGDTVRRTGKPIPFLTPAALKGITGAPTEELAWRVFVSVDDGEAIDYESTGYNVTLTKSGWEGYEELKKGELNE